VTEQLENQGDRSWNYYNFLAELWKEGKVWKKMNATGWPDLGVATLKYLLIGLMASPWAPSVPLLAPILS